MSCRDQSWRDRIRQWRHERSELARLPIAQVYTDNLRAVDGKEVENILSSRQATEEWNEVSHLIDDIVMIDDMKTGGVNPGDRRAIYTLIRALRPKRVLEIGTNVGASTIHIAAAMQRNDPAGECTFVTVDIVDVNDAPDAFWKQAGHHRSPRDNVARLGMAERVKFVVADSISYLDVAAERFDFIFLDGDHLASTVYQELPRALNRLSPEGVVLLHDLFPNHRPLWSDGSVVPGPLLAVRRLQAEAAPLDVRPLGSLPWPTKLGSNVTSLALLTRC
jgi:predicted O-methyltransferase YrrM